MVPATRPVFRARVNVVAARLSWLPAGRALVTALVWSGAAQAQEATSSTEDLAKAAQNPVADMISVPFQFNTNFGSGPFGKAQEIINIQPVIPFNISTEWNLITRTIVPVISQPKLYPGDERTFGLGDTTATLFLSPAHSGKFIWGIGPAFLLPTATDKNLGSGKWGAGPSAVGLIMEGPWVFGALINNIWSFAGEGGRQDVNQTTLQPFVNYNFKGGWYLSSSPLITANWMADDDNRWTLPVGGAVGRVFRVGKQPINAQLGAYYNIIAPDDVGPKWQIRAQLQFLFPK
ncbi:hypothetical protein ACFQU1_11110 [Chelatococcus sp. GCM10030263]|uniref:hypothetical protein n=1 Tax=Chelatococcus sp. GCM10030263 TaxID=3273387 RepID=UPI00360CC379